MAFKTVELKHQGKVYIFGVAFMVFINERRHFVCQFVLIWAVISVCKQVVHWKIGRKKMWGNTGEEIK